MKLISAIESEWSSRIKYAVMALIFGVFGLHRFTRGQIKSGIVLLILFGVSVSSIGNPNSLTFTTIGVSIAAIIAVFDVATMLIQGRFFLDEQNVKSINKF